MVRVAVTGGRTFKEDAVVEEALDQAWAQSQGDFVLIHGEAAGSDAICNAWAEAKRARGFNVGIIRYPAEWMRYGTMAGPIRNQRMITWGTPDMLIAFPGGKGTADMINRCKEGKIPITLVGEHVTEEG